MCHTSLSVRRPTRDGTGQEMLQFVLKFLLFTSEVFYWEKLQTSTFAQLVLELPQINVRRSQASPLFTKIQQ
jgi:hypothetical protein